MKLFPWVQLVLGVWVLISPWILGYWRVSPALWSGVVSGALVAIAAIWQIVGIDENHE